MTRPWDYLVEADDRLRQAERQWQELGTVESELAYLQQRLRAGKRIELDKLSVEFTRSKLGREFFDGLNTAHKLARSLSLFGSNYNRDEVIEVILDYLNNRGDYNNSSAENIHIVALGYRAYQTSGFNVYWNYVNTNIVSTSVQMCGAFIARRSGLDWQNMNLVCSHSLLATTSDIHKDTILIECPTNAVWDFHVQVGR